MTVLANRIAKRPVTHVMRLFRLPAARRQPDGKILNAYRDHHLHRPTAPSVGLARITDNHLE
jgi:hypothetical protein